MRFTLQGDNSHLPSDSFGGVVFGEDLQMELVEDSDTSAERVPCQFCNRKFVPESLAKHVVVCERTLHKKRKTFDSAKQRIRGTELAEFLPAVTSKKPEAFILPVKVKPANVQKMTNTALNVPSRTSSKVTSLNKSCNYERCPYCDRTFGPKAFDRHLEWCKEQNVRRIETKHSASQGFEEAKYRLEARIRYRAPSFRSKRSITREKYSPKSSMSDCSSIHLKSDDRHNNDARRTKSLEAELKIKFPEKLKSKEPVRETNFIRQNVLRCSYRPRITKKTETKSEKNHSNHANKKFDYSDVQDWVSANGPKVQQYARVSKTVNRNSSATSSSHDDYPDPYLLAEHQLKELLSDSKVSEQPMCETFVIEDEKTPPSNHTSTFKEERRNKFQNKENISLSRSGPVKTISCQTDDNADDSKQFKTSSASAFEKYAPTNSNPLLPSSENFLPSIANTKPVSSQMAHDGQNMNRYPLISLSNLSLCSSVSIDIPEEKFKLGPCKSAEVRGNELPAMKRSISASMDKSTANKNLVKKNLKIENMLYGDEKNSEPFTDVYDEKSEKRNGLLDDVVDDDDDDDDDTFDLANSFSEFENVLRSSYYDDDVRSTRSEFPSEPREVARGRDDSVASKISIDSAYNSLNRKSPHDTSESQVLCGKTLTSTPETTSSTLSSSSLDVDTNSQNQRKLSIFCHSCGEKFPPIAKYCCVCGVRRLVIGD